MNKKQYNAFLKETIQNIKTAIDNNNLSVFAGSGISFDSHLPLWSDLIDEIKKSLKTKESDYLKVAELFYIQFKENKYYEKLSEYFPQNAFANMLHKKIVSLNVKNIITTNWDELFEKAIYEKGEFFDIVKDDKNISYSTGFSKLVKMHGSIDTKNIVFKESDYLNYSLNFPLVENYVKSIFSTDTTLLVGYSLNDINVKQIISWVNFHSKSIKPIYFLKVNSEFDYLEFEYYKSKNIFMLYWNENLALESECSTQNVSQIGLKGQMTYNFLDKISIQNSDINLLSFKEILYVLHDTFKVFKDYQYIMPQTIVDILRKKFDLYGTNELFYEKNTITSQNEKLNKFLKFLKKLNNKKVNQFIKEILQKAKINLVQTIYGVELYRIAEAKEQMIVNHLYDFDFKGLQEELSQLSFSKNNSDISIQNSLRQAFLLYQNRDFRASYELLSKITQQSFKHRKLDVWFIALFNKKQFYTLLKSEHNYIKDDDYKKQIDCYCKDIAKIDLQESVFKLPLKYQELLKPLFDFSAFLDKKLLATHGLVESFDKDLNTFKNGGFSYNQNVNNLIQIYEEVELFINSYHLTLEYDYRVSRIYKNIFKSILINKQINKQYDIDLFIISIGVRNFGTHKELNDFIRKYFKDDIFELKDSKKEFRNLFDNLIAKITQDKNEVFVKSTRYFHNLLILLSYVSLKKSDFAYVIDKFNELLRKNILTITEYEVMNIFLVNQYKKNKTNTDNDKIETVIKEYISSFINGRFSIYTFEASRHTLLFKNIFTILKDIDKSYLFEDKKLIRNFITSIKNQHVENQNLIAKLFLSGIWFVGNKKIRETVKNYFTKLLKNKDISKYDSLELRYLMIVNKIDITLENKLIEDIKKIKEKHSSILDSDSIIMMDLIEQIEKGLKV